MLLLPFRYSSLQHRQSMDTWWQNVRAPKHGETIDDSQKHRHKNRHALKHHSIITLTGISCEAMGQLMDSFLRYSDNPWVFGLQQIWKGKNRTEHCYEIQTFLCALSKLLLNCIENSTKQNFPSELFHLNAFAKKRSHFIFSSV